MRKFIPVLYLIGFILVLLACFMLVPAIFVPDTNQAAFIKSAVLSAAIGFVLISKFKQPIAFLGTAHLFLFTTCAWLAISFASALPLIWGSTHLSFTDAVFECVSGITTTGSTVLSGLDHLPKDILLWRSLLQWLGGIGIIATAVAVLPLLRVGGMRLFHTESSDWSEKALPRSQTMVKSIVWVYVFLTVLCAISYYIAGMSLFDAINHAMTTLATGGYSTSDSSMGNFDSLWIHWIAIIFMLLGGLPFVLYVRSIQQRSLRSFADQQVKAFIATLVLSSGLIILYKIVHHSESFTDAVTEVTFNVVSVVTTTGFASTDYTLWGSFAVVAFFFLTFVGGCSGSTSGGMKIFRLQLSSLLLREQTLRLIHPNVVSSIKFNNKPVSNEIITSIVAFTFIFFISLTVMTLILAFLGLDLMTSLTGSLTALSNVGPGLGDTIGPAGNFSSLPATAKWVLCFGMLLGRLELLSILVLFSPQFWRG